MSKTQSVSPSDISGPFYRSETSQSYGDEWLTTPDAAKFVKRAAQSLKQMRCDGGGPPYYKQGRRVLYKRSDLVTWLESGTKRTVTAGPDIRGMEAA